MSFELELLPPSIDLETKLILKKVAVAHRYLAELKGISETIPNQGILINTLSLHEAQDSSAIENIITTQDDLFKEELFPEYSSNIAAIESDLKVSRLTATKYLDILVEDGFLKKTKYGRANLYINASLINILSKSNDIS